MRYIQLIFIAFTLLFYLGCEDVNVYCDNDLNTSDNNKTSDTNCTDINCTSYCSSINWSDLNESNLTCLSYCDCKPEPVIDCEEGEYNYCNITTDDQNNSLFLCGDDLDFKATCNFSSCDCNDVDVNHSKGVVGFGCTCPGSGNTLYNLDNTDNSGNPDDPSDPDDPSNPDDPSSPDDPDKNITYILHEDINATLFWIGGKDKNNNSVDKSAWNNEWKGQYGGEDTPDDRNASSKYWPAAFSPKENPFYVALPYNDMDNYGDAKESRSTNVSWANEEDNPNKSICKNRWVKIVDTASNRVAYAQWEDVGPYGDGSEVDYVFYNQNRPNGSGISISPAVRDYLLNTIASDINYTNINWKFVEEANVENGPWKDIVTTRPSD